MTGILCFLWDRGIMICEQLQVSSLAGNLEDWEEENWELETLLPLPITNWELMIWVLRTSNIHHKVCEIYVNTELWKKCKPKTCSISSHSIFGFDPLVSSSKKSCYFFLKYGNDWLPSPSLSCSFPVAKVEIYLRDLNKSYF